MICLLLSALFLCGCEKKKTLNRETLEKPELTCVIDNNNYFHCDNEDSVYDNNGNLIVITSKSSDNMAHYYYIYDNNGMIVSVLYDDWQISISYYENKKPKLIQYENGTDIIIYELFYNDNNKIKNILKSYSYSQFKDETTYEYYKENGIDYVNEKTNKNGMIVERIFKEENMPSPASIFELLNFFPKLYYQNLLYEPFYNLINVNYNSMHEYVPVYVSKTEMLRKTTFNGTTTTINYYYDKFGRYITDSVQNKIRNYKQEEDKLICETIEKVEYGMGDNYYGYYQYEIVYEYEDDKLIKFQKYPKKEITYEKYKELTDYYLEYVVYK